MLGNLTQLRELDLSRCPSLTDKDLLAVGCLTNLVSLNLTWGYPGSNRAYAPRLSERQYTAGTLRTVITGLPRIAILSLATDMDWLHLKIASLLLIAIQPSRRQATQDSALTALQRMVSSRGLGAVAAEVASSPVRVGELVALLEGPEDGGGGGGGAGESAQWHTVHSRAAVLLRVLRENRLGGTENLLGHLRGSPAAIGGLVAVLRKGQVCKNC